MPESNRPILAGYQNCPFLSHSNCTKMFLTRLKPPLSSLLRPTKSRLPFSTTASPYPLYYEFINYRPVDTHKGTRTSAHRQPDHRRRRRQTDPSIAASNGDEDATDEETPVMDRSKRRYYAKRDKRMFGSDEPTTRSKGSDEFVELEPEIVDFPRLHAREEEIYFYDAFAFPWEKNKHYRMVYQLEKKYFPDQSLDNAFVKCEQNDFDHRNDKEKNLIFFEQESGTTKGGDVRERKVADFFKDLRKPMKGEAKRENKLSRDDRKGRGRIEEDEPHVTGPYLVSRRTELPPRWDGPHGTVVLVDKPKGWTSFTVCGKLRRLVKVQKVGHAGTLDPMATGLLIVCVGKATKIVDRYQGMVKGYSGVFRLGEATSTWDADSPVTQREPWEHLRDEDIKKAAASFLGEIWQVPPMFSAIKVGGERMYDKARRGETIELAPRRISIYEFEVERSLEDRQNLIFRVTCSKGTYIRSLCADLGKALGSCAHLTALRRDSIGEYSVDDAFNFEELQELITKGYF
ncbi:tRNA pseudouridine synthase B [Rhynchospora pubera]|uniref:tRNA pseudouridine(55) synthase n=1 Tax=Rhynchospora pubera TaxID=906938 RepID=A0AAV8CTQ0_9POAL|nr:tRNA pseudouridine synthase B [Rhynchospora pubera]